MQQTLTYMLDNYNKSDEKIIKYNAEVVDNDLLFSFRYSYHAVNRLPYLYVLLQMNKC